MPLSRRRLAARSLPVAAGLLALVACSSAADPTTESSSALTAPGPSPVSQWNAGWNLIDATTGLPSGVTPSGATPGVAVTPRGLEMFDTGTDGHVYHRISTDHGVTWTKPEDLGGGFEVAAVSVATNGHTLLIAAIHGNQEVWTNAFIFGAASWKGWVATGGHTNNLGAAVAAGQWYFFLAAVGTEGHLWYNYALLPGDGGWFGWADVGGNCDEHVAPGAASWGGDRLDVIVARAGDGEAFHFAEQGLSTGVWEDLGATEQGGGVSSWGYDHYDFFIRTPSGQLQQKTWNGGWSAWSNVLGCDGGNIPVATSSLTVPGRIDLFTTASDYSIWHTFYGPGASTAPGAQPVCCGLPGTACCATSAKVHYACNGPSQLACDPASGTCQACGRAAGEVCCSVPGVSSPTCSGFSSNNIQCNLDTDRCEGGAVCGTLGHACCNGGACHDGSVCVGVTDSSNGVCHAPAPPPKCSAAGAACGAGCCSGLSCVSGKCAGPSAKTCSGQTAGGGAQYYYVDVRFPDTGCANNVYAAFANTASEALACAQAVNPGMVYNLGSASDTIGDYPYHLFDSLGFCESFTATGFSASDAQACATNTDSALVEGSCY